MGTYNHQRQSWEEPRRGWRSPGWQNVPGQAGPMSMMDGKKEGKQNQHNHPQRITGQLVPPPYGQMQGPPSISWQQQASMPTTQPPFASPVMPGHARPSWSHTPPASPTPQVHRTKRNADKPLLIVIVIFALLIAITSILGFLFTNDNLTQTPNPDNTPGNTILPTGTAQVEQREQYQQLATQYVENMTLDQMVAQLIFVDNRSTTLQTDLDYMIEEQGVGGILMSYDRLNTQEQVLSDTEKWQGQSQIPLFIGTEDEGGYVERIRQIYPERPPSANEIGLSGDSTYASSEGQKMGTKLQSLNLNTSFTPVVDVGIEDGYMDWDGRSFGYTPEDVITYAGSYMAGMQQQGLICSIKHFPGLGRVLREEDPHSTLPVLDVSKEEYYQTDMAVFKHFIQAENPYERPGFIMMTYVMVPSIDPNYPAQYSSIFVNDILREEFGYEGVIITDALVMLGSQINGIPLTLEEATVAALKAGNDMLLGATSYNDVQISIDAVKNAIASGELTEDRIKQSVTRVLMLKMERGLLPTETPAGN